MVESRIDEEGHALMDGHFDGLLVYSRFFTAQIAQKHVEVATTHVPATIVHTPNDNKFTHVNEACMFTDVGHVGVFGVSSSDIRS